MSKKGSKDQPGRKGHGRKGHLSEDDEALWSNTASTLEPLRNGKARVLGALEALEDALRADAADARRHPSEISRASPVRERPVVAAADPRPSHMPSLPSLPSAPPTLSPFDRRKARKLGAGQIAIDARIDLHGMRQAEAHTALRRFLFSRFQQGDRWVLVITGKGGRPRQNDDDAWHPNVSETGVLKRNVPMWLAEPELRAIVVSFRTAAIRHGGEGALYVHLRNAERVGR